MTDDTAMPDDPERRSPDTIADPSTGGPAVAEGRELRAIADQMLDILAELRSLEDEKRGEAMGSDEFVALAEAAEVQGRLVFRWTGLQLEMARLAAKRRARGELDPTERLTDVESRPLDRILAAWREAQFRLEIAKPGSPEASAAADEIERLRDEYGSVAATKSADAARLSRHPIEAGREARRR